MVLWFLKKKKKKIKSEDEGKAHTHSYALTYILPKVNYFQDMLIYVEDNASAAA